MNQVAIVCSSDATAETGALAATLRAQGVDPVLVDPSDHAAAATVGRSCCTVVVWSEGTARASQLVEIIETAIFRNVMVPVRSNYDRTGIPLDFRRIRPAILPALENASLEIPVDCGIIGAALKPIWSTAPLHDQLHSGKREQPLKRFRSPFLSLGLWIAACVIISGAFTWAIRNFNPYSTVELRSDAVYATARRKTSTHLEWLEAASRVRVTPQAPNLSGVRRIAIHGYNVPAGKFPSYFVPLFDNLESRTSPPINAAIDWSSGTRPATVLGPLSFLWTLLDGLVLDSVRSEVELYDLGRRNAEKKGSDALIALLEAIHASNGGQQIDIIAHSLGCHLTLEALKKKPAIAATIRHLILLAPAVPYDTLENRQLADPLSKVKQIGIYFSRNDAILRYFATLRHASPMLGAIGPKSPSRLPSNVTLHDMTEVLGIRDVHGVYLRPDGLQSLRLNQVLTR